MALFKALRAEGPDRTTRRSLLKASPLIPTLAIIALGVSQTLDPCASCNYALQTWMIWIAGCLWLCVSFLALTARTFCLSSSIAIGLTVCHAAVLISEARSACTYCWIIFATEVIACATLLLVGAWHMAPPLERRKLVGWALLSLGICLGGAATINVTHKPLETRTIGSNEAPLEISLVLRRNCGLCEESEKRLVEFLETGIPCRVSLVDITSDIGKSLVRRFGITQTPSFIVFDHDKAPCYTQIGGSVETVVKRIMDGMVTNTSN